MESGLEMGGGASETDHLHSIPYHKPFPPALPRPLTPPPSARGELGLSQVKIMLPQPDDYNDNLEP